MRIPLAVGRIMVNISNNHGIFTKIFTDDVSTTASYYYDFGDYQSSVFTKTFDNFGNVTKYQYEDEEIVFSDEGDNGD